MTDYPTPNPQSSINLDSLFAVLHPAVTSKWQRLAEVLGMDEDLTDEIFTNNETEEECLKDILDVWLKKSSPTWEGVADAVQKNGEDQLAESLYVKCKGTSLNCYVHQMNTCISKF